MNILCVDDDPLTLAVTGDLLRELGHSVLEASSGKVALAHLLADGSQIDLLVTDVLMPDMDGTTLVARAQRALPGLPAIYTTGLPFRTGDGRPVVTKPCSLGTLSDGIAQATRPDGLAPAARIIRAKDRSGTVRSTADGPRWDWGTARLAPS